MYNLNLNTNEVVEFIKDDVAVNYNNEKKIMSIVITNQRILFLDYYNEAEEFLRLATGVSYIKAKEVYYSALLKNILDNTIIINGNNKIVIEDSEILGKLKIFKSKE